MPDPVRNIARLRNAWWDAGIGDVELGAVSFHVAGENALAKDAVDFWVEMPPHGLVQGEDYLYGGALGNKMGDGGPTSDFGGLIYDYRSVARRSQSPSYRKSLPQNTIAGIMPSWDNTGAARPSWAYRLWGQPLPPSARGFGGCKKALLLGLISRSYSLTHGTNGPKRPC